MKKTLPTPAQQREQQLAINKATAAYKFKKVSTPILNAARAVQAKKRSEYLRVEEALGRRKGFVK